MATSFSGGRSWSTRREPPTMAKQLVNLSIAAAIVFIGYDALIGCFLSSSFMLIFNQKTLYIGHSVVFFSNTCSTKIILESFLTEKTLAINGTVQSETYHDK